MGIKYYVQEDFFNKWGRGMAYVLGFWYADGSLENAQYIRGKYIRVSSVDRFIIERIKKWLKAEHPILVLGPTIRGGRSRYFLRIGSHKLYNSLLVRGLYPNKSLSITFPNIPKRFLADFLRGCLDGDGCVYLQKASGKRQQYIVKKLSIIFTSGSKIFLEKLATILAEYLQLHQRKVYAGKRSFQLRYSTADSIRLFKFLYRAVPKELFFERKADIFKDYFSMRPAVIDKSIKKILQQI